MGKLLFNLESSESTLLCKEILMHVDALDSMPIIYGKYIISKEVVQLDEVSVHCYQTMNLLFNEGCQLLPILAFYYSKKEISSDNICVAEGYVIRPYIKGLKVWDVNLFPSRYSAQIGKIEKEYLMERALTLGSAAQKQYNNFIRDFKTITRTQFSVDRRDIIYDDVKGFFFVQVKPSNRNIYEERDVMGVASKREFIINCLSICHSVSPCDISLLTDEEYQLLKEYNLKMFRKCVKALVENNVSIEDIRQAFVKQETEGAVFYPITIWGLSLEELDEFFSEISNGNRTSKKNT